MSKKKQSVFERLTDSLNRVADELETANSLLYGLYTELATLENNLASLVEQVNAKLSQPLQVTVDFETFTKALEEQTPKQEKAETPTEAYPKPE